MGEVLKQKVAIMIVLEIVIKEHKHTHIYICVCSMYIIRTCVKQTDVTAGVGEDGDGER